MAQVEEYSGHGTFDVLPNMGDSGTWRSPNMPCEPSGAAAAEMVRLAKPYTAAIRAASSAQFSLESWTMRKESIHKYSYFTIRIIVTASLKVWDKSPYGIPSWYALIESLVIVMIWDLPQQWDSATYFPLLCLVSRSRKDAWFEMGAVHLVEQNNSGVLCYSISSRRQFSENM